MKELIHSGAPTSRWKPTVMTRSACALFAGMSNTVGRSVSEAGFLQVTGNYLRECSPVAGIAVTQQWFHGTLCTPFLLLNS